MLYNPQSKLVKIGVTTNPQCRFDTLTRQNGEKLEYTLSPQTYIPYIVEKVLHNKVRNRKRGEWFDADYKECVELMESVFNSKDYNRRNFKREKLTK